MVVVLWEAPRGGVRVLKAAGASGGREPRQGQGAGANPEGIPGTGAPKGSVRGVLVTEACRGPCGGRGSRECQEPRVLKWPGRTRRVSGSRGARNPGPPGRLDPPLTCGAAEMMVGARAPGASSRSAVHHVSEGSRRPRRSRWAGPGGGRSAGRGLRAQPGGSRSGRHAALSRDSHGSGPRRRRNAFPRAPALGARRFRPETNGSAEAVGRRAELGLETSPEAPAPPSRKAPPTQNLPRGWGGVSEGCTRV